MSPARVCLCALLLFALAHPAFAAAIPVPKGLEGVQRAANPEALLRAFVGVPYRDDGAVNEQGEYTLFARPDKRFTDPGLNCSGLVLAASRFLLERNFSLAEVKRDRLGDSGPGAAMGEDWDFGWDLIMNISEGFERNLLLPGNLYADPAKGTGKAPLGYEVNSPETWRELPPRLVPGCLYLVSLSMQGRRQGYGLQHYHVGLIHVADSGEAWFYQTTGKGKTSNRRDLNSAEGRASFQQAFGRGSPKKMLVIEVPLPARNL